ncbi:hypothetical protein EVAR_82803_1 [Eumeta japonica]|uniref:Uncharacterized protein n=1 Tax=Eumeta variegata TaxID=151549 RepID=A0A4C1UPI8_EUMVA|nr:hypothetical protein EVAR_82803_1 [Eumeta japonica]
MTGFSERDTPARKYNPSPLLSSQVLPVEYRQQRQGRTEKAGHSNDATTALTTTAATPIAPGPSTAIIKPSHTHITQKTIVPPNLPWTLAEEVPIVEGRRRAFPGVSHTEHTAWGSRVVWPACRQLLQDAEDYEYEVLGPDTPSHDPTDPRFGADVLDIVLCHQLPFPINVKILYDINTQHLPILITLRTTAHLTPARPQTHRNNWSAYQRALEELYIDKSFSRKLFMRNPHRGNSDHVWHGNHKSSGTD